MLIFHNNAPNESHFVLILKAYFSLELITAQTHNFIFRNYSFSRGLYCCISYDTAVERYEQKFYNLPLRVSIAIMLMILY